MEMVEPEADTGRLDYLPGCATSPPAMGATSAVSATFPNSSSPISMIASPCSVLASVCVGDTGVFSLVNVSPVIVRDGAIFAGRDRSENSSNRNAKS